MDMRIMPGTLGGTIDAIPSKSDAHRRLICAALADGPSRVRLAGGSQDIEATAAALRALGARITRDPQGFSVEPISGALAVRAQGARPEQEHNGSGQNNGAAAVDLPDGGRCGAHERSTDCAAEACCAPPDGLCEACACGADGAATVDCGESGSTLRFLLPVAAALGLRTRFVGSGRLPERPMQTLCALLRAHGVSAGGDFLPITLAGQLQSGRYELPGNISSQYISGLLFALTLLQGDSEIVLSTPLESAGYVEMTLRALADYGVAVTPTESGWLVPGGQRLRAAGAAPVEGDWSNAAFWVVAGALARGGAGERASSGGENRSLTIHKLPGSSAQGDRAIVALARLYGASVCFEDGALCVRPGPARTAPLVLDARDVPDLVPVLGVLACGARCVTTITGCARLRLKESDRVEAVCGLLGALGGDARADGDNIVVRGTGRLRGGETDSRNDHRIAMAAAVAAALCEQPVILRGAQAVDKSYPGFWRDFETLGGKADVL